MSHSHKAEELFHIPNTVAAEFASDQLNLLGRNGVAVNLPVTNASPDWSNGNKPANKSHSIHMRVQPITGCKAKKGWSTDLKHGYGTSSLQLAIIHAFSRHKTRKGCCLPVRAPSDEELT